MSSAFDHFVLFVSFVVKQFCAFAKGASSSSRAFSAGLLLRTLDTYPTNRAQESDSRKLTDTHGFRYPLLKEET